MKRVILLLALITGLAGAYPTLFGPAGMPTVWDAITSIDADSINTDHLVVNTTAELGASITSDSAATWTVLSNLLTIGASTVGDQDIAVYADSGGTAFEWFRWDEGLDASYASALAYLAGGVHLADDDSLLIYSDKYALYMEQGTQSAGDRDLFLYFIEEDNTQHYIFWNDGESVFQCSDNYFVTSYGFETVNTMTLNPDYIGSGATLKSTIYAGGNEGDILNVRANDSLKVDGYAQLSETFLTGEWAMTGNAVATYDTTSALAAGVSLAILDTAAGQDTLNLPAAASHTGRVVIIKAINANGSVVDANGAETIDGSATQALAQWDSITIYCNGTTWYII